MQKILLFLFSTLLLSFNVTAQTTQSDVKLDEVLVTATRTPTSVIEIASSYSIITSSDILRMQKSTAAEILKEVEGLSIVQQGGAGKLTSVFMRGAEAGHTLVLIDGIKLNDPSSVNNTCDLSSVLVSDIDRIEIVRGPQSTLYGSEAMSGVINIITKKGSPEHKYSVFSEAGSNSYLNSGLSASGLISDFNYFINLHRLYTGGISVISKKYGAVEKDEFENLSASAKVGYEFSKDLKIGLNYRYTYAESGIDHSSPSGDDPNYIYDTEENVFGLHGAQKLFDGKWSHKIFTALTRKISHAIDNVDDLRPAESSGNFSSASRLVFGWQNTLSFVENNIVTFGFETQQESSTSSFRSEGEWGPFESKFPRKSVRTNSFYLQDQINPVKNFFATLGIRYDDHENFGSKATYRVAAAYFLSASDTKLKATYGTGYKAPSLFNLYDPAFGNPVLNPEESLGWDIGIEQFFIDKNLAVSLTFFKTKFDQLIGYDENFRTVNINKAETEGVEFVSTYKLGKELKVVFNYTYTEAKDKSPGMQKELEDLIRRPGHKAGLNINYSPFDKINLNTGFRYVGERFDSDFSTFPSQRVKLDSYFITDLAASYKLFNFLAVKARVENLFNQNYEEVLFYGTLGRAFYFGVSLDF